MQKIFNLGTLAEGQALDDSDWKGSGGEDHEGTLARAHTHTHTHTHTVLIFIYIFLAAQMVKNLPAMQETWAGTLGREVPLEKERATHSSIPDWRIPWTEKPEGLQSMVLQRLRHD